MKIYVLIITSSEDYSIPAFVGEDDIYDSDDDFEFTVESDSIHGIFDSYDKAKEAQEKFNDDSANVLLESRIEEYTLNESKREE